MMIEVPRPLDSSYPISSGFGIHRELMIHGKKTTRIHWGYDFPCPKGTPIRAVSDGEVFRSGWQIPKVEGVNDDPAGTDYFAHRGFGLRLWQSAKIGDQSIWIFYAHLSDLWAHPGRKLKAGEMIGLSGNTGRSSGPHLHIEFRIAGTWNRIPVKFKEITVSEVAKEG